MGMEDGGCRRWPSGSLEFRDPRSGARIPHPGLPAEPRDEVAGLLRELIGEIRGLRADIRAASWREGVPVLPGRPVGGRP